MYVIYTPEIFYLMFCNMEWKWHMEGAQTSKKKKKETAVCFRANHVFQEIQLKK